jgi:hypothetical protein
LSSSSFLLLLPLLLLSVPYPPLLHQGFERIEGEFSSFPGRKTPPNGIFFYISASSKVEHFIRICSEPFLPFPSSILLSAGKDGVILRVDRHFFIKPLQELISSYTVKVGFVFIDSNGAMILVLKGGKVEVIQRVATFLPRHNKIQMAGAMKTLVQKVGQMASQELVDSEGKVGQRRVEEEIEGEKEAEEEEGGGEERDSSCRRMRRREFQTNLFIPCSSLSSIIW